MKWIRPIIISILVIIVSVGFILNRIEAQVYVPFATGLIVYWFKSRDETK